MPPATNTDLNPDYNLSLGLLREFDRIKSNPDYVVHGGQGIIYVGGGKYWPGIMVGVRLLRQLGCRLPVEIWYREGVETVYPEDIFAIPGVTLHPIPVAMGGWEAKLYALYNTWLRQVMYLDADAYCVKNPLPLFDLLNEENPFIYWRDLVSQANSVKWKFVYPDGATRGIPQVQGGQLLFDREYAWKLIHTSKYMCDNSHFYFKKMYGDQDTWRVALAGGVCDYLCLGKAAWDRVAFKCRYQDEIYVMHRCKGKLFEPEHIPPGNRLYANPHYDLPLEYEVFQLFAEYVNRRERTHSEAFNNVYKKALWGGGSGTGSTLKEGKEYINFVNNLIESNGYATVVDAGCGDGLIGSQIACRQYTGYDCSDNILTQTRKKFSRHPHINLDISIDFSIMDSSDVLLCKDVIHHWPNQNIVRFLDYLIQTDKYKCVVLCFDIRQLKNKADCHAGGYRALSVEMEPIKKYGFTYSHTFLHKGIVVIKKN